MLQPLVIAWFLFIGLESMVQCQNGPTLNELIGVTKPVDSSDGKYI